MIQIHDMKYFIFPLILLSCFSLKTTAQEQDEVINSMYRYHPKNTIQELGIDSVFIHTFKEDTTYLYGIIIYDSLGREIKYVDGDGGYEYRMDYYPSGLLKSSRIINYDYGNGPVDSFSYDNEGNITKSFHGMNYEYDYYTYKYKDGNLIEEKSERFQYKYFYKSGKRVGVEFYINNGPKLKSKLGYNFDKAGNLHQIIENIPEKSLKFQLYYNTNNLLTIMKAYNKNGSISQQYNSEYLENGLLKSKKWYISIENNDLSNCGFRKNIYTYSFRN